MGIIKPKPCPLCGSEAKVYICNSTNGIYVVIQCENCKANVKSRVKVPSIMANNWSIDIEALTHSALDAVEKWNYRRDVEDLVQKRLDGYADRIERQINETECKRDVFDLCKNAEEKARVNGFVDGLNWLLEIIDDEYTRHDEEDD